VAWKADITLELPPQSAPRKKEQRRRNTNAGSALVLLLAALAVVYSARRPAVSIPEGLFFAPRALQSTSDDQSIVVTNSGSSPLQIQTVLLTGNNADDFKVTGSTCASAAIEPGQSCSIRVVFIPRASGDRRAIVSLVDDAGDSPQSIEVRGVGVLPSHLTASPASLDFGTLNVGTQAEQQVTLANVGSQSLRVTDIKLSADGSGFSIPENNCAQKEISEGEPCVTTVVFQPATGGSQTARLVVADNSGDPPHEIQLTGNGTVTVAAKPVAEVQPSPMDFGVKPLGTSAVRSVRITNNGTGSLRINATAITGEGSGEFSKDSGCVQQSLPPGQWCVVEVTFTPRAEGPHNAELAISDDASNGAQRVALTGSGYLPPRSVPTTNPTTSGTTVTQTVPQAPRALIHPETLNFGEQTTGTPSGPQTVIISSVGNTAAVVERVSLQGKWSKDFQIQNGCAGKNLQRAETCSITVRFEPTAPIFARYPSSRDAQILVNTSGGSQTVALNGTAIRKAVSTPPSLQVSPLELGFPNTVVRQQSRAQVVTLNNPNAEPIKISMIQVMDNAFTGLFTGKNSGNFQVVNARCAEIPSQGSCQVMVEFTPQTAGSHKAYLTIVTDKIQFQQVTLSGVGYAETLIQ
jgi:hypothetical protein